MTFFSGDLGRTVVIWVTFSSSSCWRVWTWPSSSSIFSCILSVNFCWASDIIDIFSSSAIFFCDASKSVLRFFSRCQRASVSSLAWFFRLGDPCYKLRVKDHARTNQAGSYPSMLGFFPRFWRLLLHLPVKARNIIPVGRYCLSIFLHFNKFFFEFLQRRKETVSFSTVKRLDVYWSFHPLNWKLTVKSLEPRTSFSLLAWKSPYFWFPVLQFEKRVAQNLMNVGWLLAEELGDAL